MKSIITLTAIFAAILASQVHAETCNPPNVARVVVDTRFSQTESVNAIFYPMPWRLRCPVEGACDYIVEKSPPPPPPQSVVCLTPEQNTEAEARGR